MLVTHKRVRKHSKGSAISKTSYSKYSAAKALSKGFSRIGDLDATEGRYNIQNRKNHIRNRNDEDALANDWVNVGKDISISMETFKKEHSL